MRVAVARLLLSFLAASAVLRAAAAGEAAAPLPVDLALVIAVDVSASMDRDEYLLQREGYREAIVHPDFLRAVLQGEHRRIAVTYVEWSGRAWQKIIVPWRVIDGAESAEAFAAALAARPPVLARGTSISEAIRFSAALLATDTFVAERKAIDVSGDGPNNYGRPVTEARDAAVAAGIVVNGLPIVIAPSPTVPDIALYYADCVIGGPGSFMLPVRKAEEFAVAIRRKLVLEVAGVAPAGIVPISVEPPADCLAGEKARASSVDRYYPGLDQ